MDIINEQKIQVSQPDVTTVPDQVEDVLLENVLIKEATGRGDKVFVVSQLPKCLLYQKAKEMKPKNVLLPGGGVDQFLFATGNIIDELLPGIEKSQTGDGGFVIWPAHSEEAKQRLEAIDRWIAQMCPPTMRVPTREYYAQRPGDFSSPVKHISQVVRVEIPMSPPMSKDSASVTTPAALEDAKAKMKEEIRNEIMEEILAEAKRERAAHARAAKSANQAETKVEQVKTVEESEIISSVKLPEA